MDVLRHYNEIPIGSVTDEDRAIMNVAYVQPVYHGPDNLREFATGYFSLVAENVSNDHDVRPEDEDAYLRALGESVLR